MANTLKIKRGTAATIPQGQLAEPLFTTDTYDLYIGKGSGGNQRFQKYIASGTSSQFLKGDGSLDSNTYQTALTFSSPLVNTSGTVSIPAATSSVDGYLTSTNWTTFNSKEPAITAGTTLQYYRGDKTFQTLDTSVVPENGSVYFTEPKVRATVLTGLNLTGGGTIAATDSVLQAFGKVQNQISALVGGATYQGVWNASTNSPTLTSGTGTKGYYYVVSVAGSTNLDGITDWKIGDWAIFNGTTWDKVDNTDAVSSVNGFTGAVNLALDNISDVSAASPTNAQLLRFNGTSSLWENWTPTYISAAITSLNGLTGATQTFATGTTGTDFNISSSTSTHTFNIPSASTTARGLVTTETQTFAGNKEFTGAGGQSNPILSVIGSSNDNYNFLQSNLSTSLGAGKNTIILLGKSSSALNAGYMAFQWNSAGGTDNYLHFGLYDVNNVLRIYGSGNVTIAAGDTGERLNVGGSIYSSSQISSVLSNSTGVGGIIFIKNSAAAAIGNKAVLAFATDNGGTISNHPKIQAITTNNSNGASGLEFYTHEGSGNINKVLTLASDKSATFTGDLYSSGNAYFGTFNSSDKYYFEPFSNLAGGANNAYLVSGRTDNNERSGFVFQARNSNGEDYNIVTFEGNSGTSTTTALTINATGAATFTGDLYGTSATFSSRVNVNGATDSANNALQVKADSGLNKFVFIGLDSSSIITSKISAEGYATLNSIESLNIKFKDNAAIGYDSGYTTIASDTDRLNISRSATQYFSIIYPTGTRTFTLPNASGTIALTSNLSSYLPLTGGTLTGALSGTSATFSGDLTINKASGYATITTDAPSGVNFIFKQGGAVKHEIFTNSTQFAIYNTTTSSVALGIANATGAATFSSSVGVGGANVSSYLTGVFAVNSSGDNYVSIVSPSANAAGLMFQDVTGTSIVGGVRYTHSDDTLSLWANGGSRLSIASTGAATFSSSVTMGSGSQVNGGGLLKLGIATGNAGAALQFLGWSPASGYKSWQIDTAYLLGDVLSFTPSTTSGGTTFTTPVFTLTPSGAATFSSSVTATGNIVANNPHSGNTGEGIIAGKSFKISAGGTGESAKMYVVSKDLSDTYGSGLQIQFANQADDKGFGFNLNTNGDYEVYTKDTSWNKVFTATKDRYLRLATKGIQFNGDTADANSLDDYEEGTWTPAFSDAGTPSYTTQFGRYTKIGRVVFCTIALRATSVSGSSTIVLTGLPFSAADANDTGQRHTYSPRLGGHINGLSESTAKFRVNGTTMTGVKGDTSTTFMTAAQFTSGSPEITGEFWYYV